MPEEITKHYDHLKYEKLIYQRWLEADAFAAVPDERADRYVIMMPLPNITGALHMGHAMDNIMQDLLVRWHRMMGDNTLWMPGSTAQRSSSAASPTRKERRSSNRTSSMIWSRPTA